MASEDALEAALGALDRKERTAHELASWLEGRGFGRDDIDDVLERLFDAEVLDDERFARRYAEDKRELKSWGSERIRAALRDRGIADEDVEEALGDGAEEEVDRAVAILRERGETLADALERQRALGALIRRGYDSEIAYEAIRRARRD